MENNYVVGLGEALWDCLPEGRKIGGAPANFAYHAGQFGFNTIAISAIGKDELGDEIVDKFNENRLKHHLERVDFPTGTVQVQLDEKGIPQYDICEGVAWDNIPWTPEIEAIARKTRAVCFGSLAQRSEVSRQTIRKFLATMPQVTSAIGSTASSMPSLKIFDINIRQHFYSKEIIEENLRQCNILKINDEELELIAEIYGLKAISAEDQCWVLLAKWNLQMLILTCGTHGSYVYTPGEVSFVPTPMVEVADTVGAGDSFTGSFVACILQGRPVREAHERAVKVSAFVCTQNGAMPILPEELKK